MRKAKRIPFTIYENNYIMESVKQIGEDWVAISEKLPGRTPKQIKDRYINYLRDGLKRDPWTKQEEQIILTMYQSIGPRWSRMMFYLPGRSGNDIKNRWYKHIAKKLKIISENKDSLLETNKESTNLAQSDTNTTSNFIQIDQQNKQNNHLSILSRFKHNYVEPIIKISNNSEISINQQNQLEKIKSFSCKNDKTSNVLANYSCIPRTDEQNHEFVRMIGKLEIEKDEKEDMFGSDQFSLFDSSFYSTDFIVQDSFAEMFSENFDFFGNRL